MSADSLARRGARRAKTLMTDTCTIRRQGQSTIDDNTGEETEVWEKIYEGPCRIQVVSASSSPETSGEDYQIISRTELQLPLDAAELDVDDEVTITASTLDPQLAGQVFIVRDLFAKTHPTSRRLGVIRRTS